MSDAGNPIDNLDKMNCQESGADAERGSDDIPSLNLDEMLSSSGPTSNSAGARGNDIDWLEDEIADDAIERNAVLVPKKKRGDFGSRNYIRNLEAATSPLDPKMGVPSHFNYQQHKKWGHRDTKEEEKEADSKNTDTGASPPPATVPEGDGATAVQANQIVTDKDKLLAVLREMECNTTSNKVGQMCSAFHNIFSLG